MANVKKEEVRVVVSPYRICPLGAHIDHQGRTVLATTINKGILLGFTPSGSDEVSAQDEQRPIRKELQKHRCCIYAEHPNKKKTPRQTPFNQDPPPNPKSERHPSDFSLLEQSTIQLRQVTTTRL